MPKNPAKMNTEVTAFLDAQNHPLKEAIDELRSCILSAGSHLSENIKWNGPNYSINGKDRMTMKIQPPKYIQLIFHRGAKKQEQPPKRLIEDPSGLLVWKENDRAVATFKTVPDIEANKPSLAEIIQNWLIATG